MAKRDNHYEAAFEAWLRWLRIPFVAVDESHRRPGEEVPDLPAARDRDPVSHVGRRLDGAERPDVPAKRDPLVQLDEPGMQQEGTELGLPDEDDAEELLGRRLEVREKTELLQRLDRERLRLVDDHDGAASCRPLGEEVVVQLVDQDLRARARCREAELAVDRLQELERGERRIEDVGGRDVGPQVGQVRA